MGILSALKPGENAVLSTLTREGTGYREKSDLIKIIDIAPHQGKTVNGLKVERPLADPAPNADKINFDEVDIVTYQIQNSRDTEGSKVVRSMLYGEYVQDDGTPRDHCPDIVDINHLDATGKPHHALMNGDDNPEEPIVMYKIQPLEDYVSWSVNTRNDLRASLAEAQKPFWKRFFSKK